MKELKDSGLIAVPVPMEAKDFEMDYHLLCTQLTYPVAPHKGVPCRRVAFVGRGRFEIIGWCTADEISFDPEPYVESQDAYLGDFYKDYTNGEFDFLTAEEAFRSLLTANGVLFVNPYGEEMPIIDSDDDDDDPLGLVSAVQRQKQDKWQQSESQLVKKVLILKPINQ